MAGLFIEFPTTNLPVTLAEAKLFLRVDNITDDDLLITTLISAATGACETFLRRSIMKKGYLQTLDSFPYFNDTALTQLAYPPNMGALPRYSTTLWNYSQMIKLYRPPLISVDRISYFDSGVNSFADLVPQPQPWYPQTVYTDGDEVADSNGNVQQLVMGDPSNTATGKSGIRPPNPLGRSGGVSWNTVLNGVTAEASPATAIWINKGPMQSGQFGAYIVDTVGEPARLFPGISSVGSGGLGFWPSVSYVPNAVQIHFTAGYGNNTTDVPDAIRQAILQLVANLYETREPVKEDACTLPPHVKMMLYPYTVMDFTPTRG
jgi:hypothetical protein